MRTGFYYQNKMVRNAIIFWLLLLSGQGSIAWADEPWCNYSTEIGMLVGDSNPPETEHYPQHIQKLETALALPDLKPCERSTIFAMLGHLHYEIDDLPQAIANSQKAINAGGLQADEVTAIEKNIAQLQIANGDYVMGARALISWIETNADDDPNNYKYIMQALVQAELYREALPYAEKWFENATPKERKHYDLMNFLYNYLGMQVRQGDIIIEMLERWPDDQALWDGWISLLINGGRERDAFDVHKMRYQAGHYESARDLMRLVEYYNYYDQPYQGAMLLEAEMALGRIPKSSKNYRRLFDLYTAAREPGKALDAIERAVNLTKYHKVWTDYGLSLCQAGRVGDAETAFRQAMENGGSLDLNLWAIANCHYEQAQKIEPPKCAQYYDIYTTDSPRYLANEKAIEALGNVRPTDRYYDRAQEIKIRTEQENIALAEKCGYPGTSEREHCFLKIRRANKLELFSGEFDLGAHGEQCGAYVPEYDNLHGKN